MALANGCSFPVLHFVGLQQCKPATSNITVTIEIWTDLWGTLQICVVTTRYSNFVIISPDSYFKRLTRYFKLRLYNLDYRRFSHSHEYLFFESAFDLADPSRSNSMSGISRDLLNQHNQEVDLAGRQQDCLQGRGEEPVADWDPLQGGYQAIIDICEAARSKPGAWDIPLHCYEPERYLFNEVLDNASEISRTMPPPPEKFHRIRKNSNATSLIFQSVGN